MKKQLEGIVVSTRMEKTAVVEVKRKKTHPLYKKVLTRSKKYKAGIAGFSLSIGDKVKIEGTAPISKDKHFAISQVLSHREEEREETQ